MNSLGYLYKRWRHGRGFGVHSPLAFYVCTEVIRPGCAYYAYPDIDASLEPGVGLGVRRRARMLHRLAARLDVGEVSVLTPLPEAVEVALGSVGKLYGDRRLYVAFDPDAEVLKALGHRCCEAGCVVAAFGLPAGWSEKRAGEMPFGVAFHDRRAILAVAEPDVAKVEYSIRL